jgi:hypothetical protein
MAAAQPRDELRDSHGKPRAERGGIVRGIEPLDRDELRSQGRQRRATFSTMGITFTVCSDGRGPRPGVAARRHPSIQSERRERLADHALHGVAPQLDQNCLQTQALHQPVQRRPSGGVPDRRISVALPGVEAWLLLHSTSVVSSESCRRSAELGSTGSRAPAAPATPPGLAGGASGAVLGRATTHSAERHTSNYNRQPTRQYHPTPPSEAAHPPDTERQGWRGCQGCRAPAIPRPGSVT